MSTASGANAQAAGRGGSQESTSNAQAAASGSQGNNQISDPQQANTPQHSPAEEETVSLEHAKKIRQENATLRDRLAQLETAQKEAELAKLGDLEKTQKQYADLQEKYASLEVERQNWRLADAIARHAPAIGLIDPDAARLMLLNGGELETDKDGGYTNVEKLLEKLVVAKPYLVASNNTQPRQNFPTSGGATNPGRSAAPAAQQSAKPTAEDLYRQHRQGGGLGNPNLWKKNP